MAAYEKFWEAEQAESARADLVLAMELRDAYFLWRVCEAATIYYAALIFLQDEAMSDYAAEVYLRQLMLSERMMCSTSSSLRASRSLPVPGLPPQWWRSRPTLPPASSITPTRHCLASGLWPSTSEQTYMLQTARRPRCWCSVPGQAHEERERERSRKQHLSW